MTSLTKSLPALALVLPVLMFAAPAKADMSGDQIKAAVSGKTLDFAGKYNGTMDLGADGSASMTLKLGVKKSGKWRVDGDKFCTQWGDEGEQCGTWQDEGGKYVTSNGYTMTPQ